MCMHLHFFRFETFNCSQITFYYRNTSLTVALQVQNWIWKRSPKLPISMLSNADKGNNSVFSGLESIDRPTKPSFSGKGPAGLHCSICDIVFDLDMMVRLLRLTDHAHRMLLILLRLCQLLYWVIPVKGDLLLLYHRLGVLWPKRSMVWSSLLCS